MKLLYVAITRALHEVTVCYSGNLTNVLSEYNDVKTKKKTK
jgi:ATP-dependent exoDNAse (exonuclease V) beta subunit